MNFAKGKRKNKSWFVDFVRGPKIDLCDLERNELKISADILYSQSMFETMANLFHLIDLTKMNKLICLSPDY